MASVNASMWSCICVVILVFIVNCKGVPLSSGIQCIYNPWGLCVKKCPPDTVAYKSDCDTVAKSQRTCRHPKPRDIGAWCGLSRCDCIDDYVWDEVQERCVMYNDCSPQYI